MSIQPTDRDFVNIDPAGREYVRWPISIEPPSPAAVVEVSLDGGATWTPGTRDADEVVFLVAGRRAPDHDGQVRMPAANITPMFRVVSAPEIVIRRSSEELTSY